MRLWDQIQIKNIPDEIKLKIVKEIERFITKFYLKPEILKIKPISIEPYVLLNCELSLKIQISEDESLAFEIIIRNYIPDGNFSNCDPNSDYSNALYIFGEILRKRFGGKIRKRKEAKSYIIFSQPDTVEIKY